MGRLAAVFAAAGLALMRGPAGADGKDVLPPDLARVPSHAAIVVTLRPAHLLQHDLLKALRGKVGKGADDFAEAITKSLGLPPGEVERVTFVMTHVGQGAFDNPLTLVAVTKSIDRAKLVAALVPGGEEKTHGGLKYVANETNAVVVFDDKHFARGNPGDVQSMLEAEKTKPASPLMPALKLAAGKCAVVVAVNPEPLPKPDELPAEWEAVKPLLRAKVGLLTLDAAATSKASLSVEFAGIDDAKDGAKAVEAARNFLLQGLRQYTKQFGKMEEAASLVKLAGQLNDGLQSAKVTRDGAAVRAAFEVRTDAKTLGPLLDGTIARMRTASARMRDANQLKQIALGLHNYHATCSHFPPPAVHDKDGKPLLSWRVLILPYIEQDDLYREFKLNEAWDSPHNKKLLAKMPQVFKLAGAKTQNAQGTFYQVLFGKGAAFEGKTGNTIASFTDGTSNTILAVEAGKDVPWTKPEDVPFDDTKEVPKLGGHHDRGFNAAFADGAVRFLLHTINKDTLKGLITRNGGEVLGNF